MKHIKIITVMIAIFVVALIISGCTTQTTVKTDTTVLKEAPKKLMLATTTSTYETGLLDYILPVFESKYNYEVQVLSVGTGQALKNGQDGNVDVVLVHAPASEKKFLDDGYGINRQCVMYNDFLIIGPSSDPAKIRGLSVNDALKAIAQTKSVFISRGDNSGTHVKELELWKKSDITAVNQSWHLETGLGMAETYRVAKEKLAYTLTDRATYLNIKTNITELEILVQGDNILLNPYGVIVVNPEKNPNVNVEGAQLFEDWLMSNKTQDMIGGYKKGGEVLYHPLRGVCLPGQ